MPSALSTSRRLLSEALARVRAGAESYERNLDQPGQDIKVEPFDATNVSTPAALIKLGTSIAAAKRRAANLRESQKDVELARQKTQAEIARLRAQAQNEGKTDEPKRLGMKVGPYPAGTLLTDVNADIANRRLEEQGRSRGVASAQGRRLTAARAALADIDAKIKKDTLLAAQKSMTTAEPVFQEIIEAGESARPEALKAVGIDPETWALSFSRGGPTTAERAKIIENARKAIFAQYVRKHEVQPYIRRYYEPQRRKYQQIIEETATAEAGFEDPNDPLGMNPLGLDLE